MQSISKTLTALERTSQVRMRRQYNTANLEKFSDDDDHILDNESPSPNRNRLTNRMLDTGHNRKRINIGEKEPIRGEESQVMSVDVTNQYEEEKDGPRGQYTSRDW